MTWLYCAGGECIAQANLLYCLVVRRCDNHGCQVDLKSTMNNVMSSDGSMDDVGVYYGDCKIGDVEVVGEVFGTMASKEAERW